MNSKENNELYSAFKASQPEFAKIRHDLHQIPEIKFKEVKTAAYIAGYLRDIGYTVQTDFGGTTGIVALLDSGKPGKTVAIRADMDALPICEKNTIEYKSQHEGMMHACGHDGHMATVLMAAKVLGQNTDKFQGRVKFIFQPAEEGGAGAKVLIEAGVLENPKVDAIFGYHNMPIPKGDVVTRLGPLLASSDSFEIQIQGKGGHAAWPHLTHNPIIDGANIIQNLLTLISQKNPTDAALINIGAFHAGTVNNVVPDTAVLLGTLRTVSPTTRESLKQKITAIVENCCNSVDSKGTIKFSEVGYPSTVNAQKGVDIVLKSAREIVAPEKVYLLEHPVIGSEDFSFYLEKIPGCFFFVGIGHNKPSPHAPDYNFDDDILPTAAYVLTSSAIAFLNEK